VNAIPPVRRRLLGAALRGYREGLGFNLDQAAVVLECDRSKISRVETGQRGIRAKELRELLAEYGVPAAECEALLAIAHSGREDGWWLGYRDVLTPAGQDYVSMESAATEILAYEPNQVPDLLQTLGYARAVADADPGCTSDEQRGHAVEVKMTRQRLVLGDRDPRLEFVITEGALRQLVGGKEVMRAQLTKLATIADASLETATATMPESAQTESPLPGSPLPRPAGKARSKARANSRGKNVPGNITLRVLPFASGAYAAAGSGGMTMLRFAAAPDIGVIHLSGLAGGISLEGRDTLTRYLRAFSELRAAALAPSASARMLRALAGECQVA
jgi:transcriptional regulator with XRE-family HTH domain